MEPTKVSWWIVDSTHPIFNIWECTPGYRETFFKNEDPNIIKPYGERTREYKKAMELERLRNEQLVL